MIKKALFFLVFNTAAVLMYGSSSFAASNNFFIDNAGIITQEDRIKINQIATDLMTHDNVPLIVVTTPSLHMGTQNFDTINDYARIIFNSLNNNDPSLSHIVLIAVSSSDKKIAILLGNAWGQQSPYHSSRKNHFDTEAIININMLPLLLAGHDSAAIMAGVNAIDYRIKHAAYTHEMANNEFASISSWLEHLPQSERLPLFLGGFIIALLFIINAIRKLFNGTAFQKNNGNWREPFYGVRRDINETSWDPYTKNVTQNNTSTDNIDDNL